MNAERLREAATRLREVAGAALAETGGSWHAAGGSGYVIHVDTMSPSVALALADWLDSTANDVEHVHDPIYNLTSTTVSRALLVADAVLGGEGR